MGVFLFFITYLFGFIVTIGLRYLYRIIIKKVKSVIRLLIIVFMIIILAVAFWYFIDILVSMIFWDTEYTLKYWKTLNVEGYFRNNYLFYILIFGWTALYFGIKYWREWQNERRKTEEAMHLAQKAQFEMLRYQLNPHFLFNSLNSIRAMIDEDRRSAKTMITELSEFLRYSLLNKDIAFKPLKDELEALEHYLAIEKKRFEEKIELNIDIEKGTENVPVISFLLHPIVENAIKYGMQTSDIPLKLMIRSYFKEHYLIIEIRNSGIWIKRDLHTENSGTGTGLINVQKRLENAYNGNYIFDIEKGYNYVNVKLGISTDDYKSK